MRQTLIAVLGAAIDCLSGCRRADPRGLNILQSSETGPQAASEPVLRQHCAGDGSEAAAGGP